METNRSLNLKFIKGSIFFIAILFACSESASSNNEENVLPLDPFEQNKLLAKTINLGNALEAENEGEWGIVLQEDYFQIIAEAGFTAVRVPCRWSAHVQNAKPYTLYSGFLSRVQWVLKQAEKYGLATIINIQHFEEIFESPAQEKEKFLAIWAQLAEKFRSQGTDVFYEILNEPHDNLTAELWNVYLKDAVDVIRQIDTVHTVIIGTAEWGGITAMNKLLLPQNEKNLIFTFHYYSPFEFTHQGAEWVENSEAWLGTTWMGSASEISAITSEFSTVKQWSVERNVPVFLGEFGAYSMADMPSRERWTNSVARIAESEGFSWAYWEFAAGFGVYDLSSNTWREELLKALIP